MEDRYYGSTPPRTPYGSKMPPRRRKVLIIVLLCIMIGVMVAAIVVTVYWQGQFADLRAQVGTGNVRREFSADAAVVESIEVNSVIEGIRIERGEGSAVEVRQYANSAFKESYLANMKMEGSRLVVRTGIPAAGASCLGSMWGASSQLVLSIPDGCAPDVTATSISSGILARDIKAGDVKINCTSGNCEASGLECDMLQMETLSGESIAKHTSSDVLLVSSTSGSASATDVFAKDEARVSTVSGSTEFSGNALQAVLHSTSGSVRADVESPRVVNADTTSGNISVDIEDAADLKSISCAAVSGGVSLSLPKGTAVNVSFDSVSGTLDTSGADGLELSTKGIPVQIQTTSGSAHLRTI